MSPSFVPATDVSLLLRFPPRTPNLADQVFRVFEKLRAANDPLIRDLHPTYASILIEFDPLRTTASKLVSRLAPLVEAATREPMPAAREIEIPTFYDGPDLAFVAEHARLSTEEVVHRHSEATYRVAFLGFQPGFPYLLGLPPELATPRLATPRLHVPAGSVGIAGDQTGVYPLRSPGGWQLIGRTPRKLFDPTQGEPTLLRMGDRIRFTRLAEWPA